MHVVTTSTPSVNMTSTRVLIVEHDLVTADQLRRSLAIDPSGTVSSSTVATLSEALQMLERIHTDCVLLDLGLPDSSGLDALETILDRHPGVAVVVLTRRHNDQVAIDAVRLGAQDHLCTRDLTAHDLQRSVGYAVERTSARLAERRLTMLLNRAAEVVLVIDAEQTVTFASASVTAVLGYAVEEVVGEPCAFFTHPDDMGEIRAEVQRVLLDPEPPGAPFVVRALHTDGSLRWGEVTIANLLHDPAIGGLVLNIRDITERHNVTRELQAEHARRDAIVARSNDLAMFFEPDGTIAWASPATRTFFGVDPEEVVGMSGLELVHPLDQERVFADFASIEELGDHVTTEFRVFDVNGKVRWIEEIATNMLDEPTVGVIVGNLRDVTDRKATEEAVLFQARLLRAAGQAILAFDQVGTVLFWNVAATRTYGWTEHEALGRDVSTLLLAADGGEEQGEQLGSLLRGSGTWSGELRVRRKDGVTIPVHVTTTPLLNDDGELVATIGVSSDITERVELHRQFEQEHRRMSEAQASAQLGSLEVDLDTGEFSGSEELWRILGREPGSLSSLLGAVHPADHELVRRSLEEAVAGREGAECTHRIVRPDGELRWVVSRSSGFLHSDRHTISGTMLDITDRREAELAVEQLAYHDQLTGLANRMNVTGRLESELATAAATGATVAVAMLDVDQFKSINDALGHSAGDSMLKAVAHRLESALTPGELLARFGGDEFAVVHGGLGDSGVGDSGVGDGDGDGEVAAELGARLLAAFDQPIRLGQRGFKMSVSIGVALGHSGDTSDSLFLDADAAMYHAKATGRARVAVFDADLQVRSHRRRQVEVELHSALEREQFAVVFQPILDLATMHTSGFEALLRWTHPVLGSVRPDEFIPIAEETGMILPIGDWVLEQSLAQLAVWHRTANPASLPWVAVNLSARQIEQQDLVEHVARALADSAVPSEYLHMEITESILMESIDFSFERLVALRELGVRISIDDFGTGYSSLSYLKRLPIDTLKIDRSFIDGLGNDPDDTSIVQTIVSLATTLHLHVLAEGVENDTQLQALIELGCTYGQGFLWSPGVAPDAAGEWLSR